MLPFSKISNVYGNMRLKKHNKKLLDDDVMKVLS